MARTDTLVTVVAKQQPVVTIVSQLQPRIVVADLHPPQGRIHVDRFIYRAGMDVVPTKHVLGGTVLQYLNGALNQALEIPNELEADDEITLVYLTT